MKVLSLFDWISCWMLALERAWIKVDVYYASEIDKYAQIVSEKNYPNIVRLWDVNNWREWDLWEIDLIIGWSPCQWFSFAGKQLAFDDPRSKLFFTMVDIINHYKPRYFLLENVKMKKEFQDVITQYMWVQPIEINSSLVSAQNRKRLYWTNIPWIKQPIDKKIYLKDIIQSWYYNWKECADKICKIEVSESVKVRKYMVNVEKLKITLRENKYYTCKEIAEELHQPITLVEHRFRKDKSFAIPNPEVRPILKKLLGIQTNEFDKSIMEFEIRDGKFEMAKRVYNINGKSPTITTITWWKQKKIIDDNEQIRELTPIECERLQTVPYNYTSWISDSQRYKMLWNWWTVDVIAHIFSYIQK